MGLAQEDIEYIKDHLGEWLADVSESLSKRMDRFMIWTFGLIVAASGFIVSMFKILG